MTIKPFNEIKLFTDDLKEITIWDDIDISTVTVIPSLEDCSDKSLDLSNTVGAMLSDNYKFRFWAEYAQTKIRYEKLHKMIIQIEAGTCDFEPDTPLELLKEQARYMGLYLHVLEIRAEVEKIPLERWV